MSTRDFFDTVADEGSEEDEDFDEETGEAQQRASKTNGLEDSSEEESDEDDDGEEARRIREGFIVDEIEDEDDRRERRRERKKRRREEAEDEQLDAEDLDLIGETLPGEGRQTEQSKYKRLKRGHRDERAAHEARGVEDIFSDDDDDAVGNRRPNFLTNEMDDFIEEDPYEDGGELDEDMEIRQPSQRAGFTSMKDLVDSGYDEADLEDVVQAFGNGDEYEWALENERARADEEQDPERALELKDVFEPSQLVERMLTDADNTIRMTDLPERFQLARRPYSDVFDLPDEERVKLEIEEANWITDLMWPRQRLSSDLHKPFRQVVARVLDYMNKDGLEPPFIFNNRKDYLIHQEGIKDNEIQAEKLVNVQSLWDVFDHDLKFRAFAEKRAGIRKSIELMKEINPELQDVVFEELLPTAISIEELQDIQDYINFQYGQQMKDISIAEAEAQGTQKRAQGSRNVWDKVRSSSAYHLVRAFGINADAIAQNAAKIGRKNYTEDPDMRPDDLADTLVQEPGYRTGAEVLTAAKAMFIEELVMSPRMRKHMRKVYFEQVVFDAVRTEKGLKQIDEDHPYYEFKYLRKQDIRSFVERPELFLRMVKAEESGLVEIRARLLRESKVAEELRRCIESDAFSDVADAWNTLRKETIDLALKKLHRIMARSCKETVKNECENSIAIRCRVAYNAKLDQAPYKPQGMILGTTPRVFALSNGAGNRSDAICWAYVDEHARVLANGKYSDLRLGNVEKYQADGKDVAPFVEEIRNHKPDVIAVSGWSVETRRLYKDLQDIIKKFDLRGTPYEDEDKREISDELDVVIVNDEVARLYHTSERAATDHPGVPPLTRYAVALAAYMQDPLKQYAALGKDVASISFDPDQHLIPEEKLMKYLETVMVDTVNLVGVEINDAIHDPLIANLLPYISGLGPRKAAQMLKVVNASGGEVLNRSELVGDVENNKKPAMGPRCFINAASFLYLIYDKNEPESEYLDYTRIHPEDYDIARKMAADALEYDEEDVAAEVAREGPGAIIRKLITDGAQERVNDLVLEQYAAQLENKFGQRKRATLETIRMELMNPYEELRRNFVHLGTAETFTMLTGETLDSLQEGMIVPVSIKRTFSDHIEVKLDCGIEGSISATEFPEDMVTAGLEPRQFFSPHQTVRAKLMHLDAKSLLRSSLRDSHLREPFKKKMDHEIDEWDEDQEAKDKRDAKKASQAKNDRAQRVIKHPLFRNFSSAQAEAFLATQGPGDCVIRPSSKGLDHLAVTWKVHDNLYQHLDVLELDKENEFSVGRALRVGKSTYSDLDELIVLHVQAMARKVDEMMRDERYQSGTKEQTGQWLTTYTEANPKRSMYAFCLNPKYAGYFYLCFKNGQMAPLANWPVKIIPNAFELQGNKYPDMQALKNGFKTLMMNHGPAGIKGAINGRR
ncbi:hypothetical protein AMS68_006171 [Peltaster fructicola]|uniref:Transcription elongation factor Spt6 n=1 Tax=Peltaster fructicola TaxID=286661 RepID=A0A6H0Y0W9_9PEZI|nr:hypothetical protein AMS68_006171 [Peltaster fructicola]